MPEIKHDPSGNYYTLSYDGIFIGNFDTYSEAQKEAEQLESEGLL